MRSRDFSFSDTLARVDASHRKKRSEGTFKNELEDIKGIGNATADMLLKEYKSVKNIVESILQPEGPEKLEKLVGKAKAKLIISQYLRK